VRVEGYTDDRPISTSQFPSNWELSAARAASVVHLFSRTGMLPERLAMIGYGEFRPIADNATEQGRNSNRRVLLVILATDQQSSATPLPYVVAPGAAGDSATGAVAANTGDGAAPAMNGPAVAGVASTAAASTEPNGGGPSTTGKIQGAQ
jgi:chemotaxis protein MotB